MHLRTIRDVWVPPRSAALEKQGLEILYFFLTLVVLSAALVVCQLSRDRFREGAGFKNVLDSSGAPAAAEAPVLELVAADSSSGV